MAWIEVRTKRSGFTVKYVSDDTYIEKEFSQGADCIAEAPTVTKSGWTFIGWREDTEPVNDVLSSLTADHDGIFLYAVFKQTITITLSGGDSPVSDTGDRYYNNYRTADASIELSATTKSGWWTLVGYRTDTSATASVAYNVGSIYTFDSNKTLYSVFKQNITVTLSGGDSIKRNTGVCYYNSTNIKKASITLDATSKSGWTLVGYSSNVMQTETVSYIAGSTYEFDENTWLYSIFKQEVRLIVTAAGVQNTRTDYKYYKGGSIVKKAKFTFADPTLDDADFKGYSDSNTSTYIDITSLANGIEIEQDTYYYAVWTYHNAALLTTTTEFYGRPSDSTDYFAIDVMTINSNKYEQLEITTEETRVAPLTGVQDSNIVLDIAGTEFMRAHYSDPEHGTMGNSIEPEDIDNWWTDDGTLAHLAGRTLLSAILPASNSYIVQIVARVEVSQYNDSGAKISRIDGIGRTVVY